MVWLRSQSAVSLGGIGRPFLRAGRSPGRERAMASITVLGQRRAAAEVETIIAQVERGRREQLAAAGRDPAPVRTLLQLTEDYLACLRQSRSILLWELPGEEPRPGAAPTPAGVTGATGDTRPRLAE